MNPLESYLHKPRIAYFSMEIALQSDIPTYSGGLGVLAGDTLRTCADLEVPLVGITLVSRMGYFRQEITRDGRQVEFPDTWQPEEFLQPLEAKIAVPLEDRKVWVQAWLYEITSGMHYKIPVILLDTDVMENAPEDRDITHYLYGKDDRYRLKQEIVLGIGGARMLQALGFRVQTYHLNEGHSALLGLELLRRYERDPGELGPGDSKYDVSQVKELCLFTTHTPVEAGHDQFTFPLVKELLDDFIDLQELQLLVGQDRLNMTRLALNLSGYVNGVAESHARTSNTMFPGYHVHAITNGIHPWTWCCASFHRLYERYIPNWCMHSEKLIYADQIPDEEIWAAHQEAKAKLVEMIRETTDISFQQDAMTIGFARRMTEYKRPLLLFSDLERLKEINHNYPIQIVISGKAHPQDVQGKNLIAQIHAYMKTLGEEIRIAYLPNYNMDIAKYLVSGTDLWLNTPLRPLEASGTSGMKAALNGIPNFSVQDGWWEEGCIEGVTGWSVGSNNKPDANGGDPASLYKKLEETILPLYYRNRPGWINVMKGAITKNASYFNSHRMMRRYATEAYIR
jgi:starch phosphorylase